MVIASGLIRTNIARNPPLGTDEEEVVDNRTFFLSNQSENSMTSPLAEDHSPFKALLAAWSLVVVVLAVAGFSSRWNYYYNFGLQSLVFQVLVTSLPVYAIEIVRDPENLADLLRLAILCCFPSKS